MSFSASICAASCLAETVCWLTSCWEEACVTRCPWSAGRSAGTVETDPDWSCGKTNEPIPPREANGLAPTRPAIAGRFGSCFKTVANPLMAENL